MRALIRGYKGFSNQATTVVQEYLIRKSLAELGYTSPLSELPAHKAELFAIISSSISEIEVEEMKRKSKHGK